MLIGCSGSSEKNNNHNKLIPAVEATKTQYGSLPLVERLSGVVKAKNQVDIFPEITALIENVHVQNGDEVKKGDPLVSLRDVEFQEQYKQAQAALQIAQAQAKQAEAKLNEIKNDLERTRTLAKKGMASDADLQSIETQAVSAEADVELSKAKVEQAKATVAEGKEKLFRTIIRSPITGSVGNRNAEIGMKVNPSNRLFTIGQLDTVRVGIILTDRMLEYIKNGQRTEILSSYLPAGKLTASLTRISPFLHPVTHSTEGEIEVANPDHTLKSGMFTNVDIFYGESEKATLVPLSALYENPLTGETGVYIANDTSNMIPDNISELNSSGGLTEPIPFQFIAVDVIAKGRMSAGVNGIDPGSWVVTLGQDLFGGESSKAKMRPVQWKWVEHLQNLQREDLLEEIVEKKQPIPKDTTVSGT